VAVRIYRTSLLPVDSGDVNVDKKAIVSMKTEHSAMLQGLHQEADHEYNFGITSSL
jgi:hypothetical protein